MVQFPQVIITPVFCIRSYRNASACLARKPHLGTTINSNIMRILTITSAVFCLGLFSCQSSDDAATKTFNANAATIAETFAEFEAEDDHFFTHFADDAIWRGTGLNAPDSIPLDQVTLKYKALWAQYDYELVSEVNFLPGVNAQTKKVDGSVRGYFKWNITKPATDSTEAQSIAVKVYESFDFNPEGQINFTQVYGNLESAYAELE